MRLQNIYILESVQTDFYDMYLLSSVPHFENKDVQTLLTDRVDNLIEYFRTKLYQAFIIRVDSVIGSVDQHPTIWEKLSNINDINDMVTIVKDIVNSGDICLDIIGHDNYWPEDYEGILSGAWEALVEIFYKLCDPPKNLKMKILLLDKFFGSAHNNGSVVDYLNTPWLFDALYVKALAHPNELAQKASVDARQVAKTGYLGSGLGSSVSGYKPVSDTDKLNLFKAKKERPGGAPYPAFTEPPEWLKTEIL